MEHENMTLEQALEHVKQKRRFIQPNPGFLLQLKELEGYKSSCELCRLRDKPSGENKRTFWYSNFNTKDLLFLQCDQ